MAEKYPSSSQRPSQERCFPRAINPHVSPPPAGPQPHSYPACRARTTREAGGRPCRRRRACAGAVAAAAAGGASARRSSLSRSQPSLSFSAPCSGYSPSLRLPSGLGSPYPMCFLLSARVSCLQYSSHMVAEWRGAPRCLPCPVCAPPREPTACLSSGPFLPSSSVGSLCPGLRRALVALTSKGHLPFKSCPAFALPQAPPSSAWSLLGKSLD